MKRWLRELDRILRGEATHPSTLRDGGIQVPVGGLLVLLVVLGLLYGACMGTFALFNRDEPGFQQFVATMLKVPALFFLTLLVTTPSLYVFNALVGSRLGIVAMVRLLVAAMGVTLAVLASFGPIVAFFSVTTPNYHFMSLLNVLVFTVAGVLGLVFLLQTLHRLSVAASAPLPNPDEPAQVVPVEPSPAGALERPRGQLLHAQVKVVFGCWIIVFAVVGAQMAWVLRPFIGDPRMPFTWFRARESNFFEALGKIIRNLLL